MKDFVLFPLLHPAAALHQSNLLVTLKEGFKKLKEFLDRHSKPAELTSAAPTPAGTDGFVRLALLLQALTCR
jgi:DNA polymerase